VASGELVELFGISGMPSKERRRGMTPENAIKMMREEQQRILELEQFDVYRGKVAGAESFYGALGMGIKALEREKDLLKELWRCRNELCLLCGQYKNRHLGACDGCRWKDLPEE